MSTNRSLNKLEFKAHMSIHDKVAVSEGETRGSRYTRDRFGKKHSISNADGSLRVRRIKKSLLVLALLPAVPLLLDYAPAIAQSGRNTDVQVESSTLDEWAIDDRLNTGQDERPIFYNDGSTSVGFNEDGDPNMMMRF